MPDQTPETERRARSRRMSELDGELGAAARRAFLGQTRPVLYESCVPPAGEDAGAVSWFGLTDNYLRVRVTALAGLDLHNRIAPTRLIGLEGGDLVGRIESDERSTGASK
jgi:tRNA A37 methylthiotransferase MiaB